MLLRQGTATVPDDFARTIKWYGWSSTPRPTHLVSIAADYISDDIYAAGMYMSVVQPSWQQSDVQYRYLLTSAWRQKIMQQSSLEWRCAHGPHVTFAISH